MAQRKKENRIEKLNMLQTEVNDLNTLLAQAQPNIRLLEKQLGEVRDAIFELKGAHVRYISDDKTTPEEIDQAKTEYQEKKQAADLIVCTAQEKLEILTAPETMPEDQLTELNNERVKIAVNGMSEKAKALDGNLTTMENPTKGKLDRLHDMVALLRTEAHSTVSASLKPFYDASLTAADTLLVDKRLENNLKPVNELLDRLEKKIVDKTPDTSSSIVSGVNRSLESNFSTLPSISSLTSSIKNQQCRSLMERSEIIQNGKGSSRNRFFQEWKKSEE